MSPRRLIPCLLTLLLLGAFLANGSKREWADKNTRETLPLPAGSPAENHAKSDASHLREVFSNAESVRLRSMVKKSPLVLPASIGIVLAEEIDLRALGESAALELNAEQWKAFAEVSINHQAIRHAYEAEIASVVTLGSDRHRMEIPPYPEAGDALRADLYATLRMRLGEGAAGEISEKLGRSLESRFAGFGVAVQTLEFVETQRAQAPRSLVVTRTSRFWSSESADERLSARTETCIPAMEDPDGEQWGPLLARLDVGATKKRGG